MRRIFNELDELSYCSFYMLNDDKTFSKVTKEKYPEWAKSRENWEEFVKSKRIGRDEIDGKIISTVFLEIDHSFFNPGEIPEFPILFETMIFDEEDAEIYCEQYQTYAEAEEGHKRAIQWVKYECKNHEEMWLDPENHTGIILEKP